MFGRRVLHACICGLICISGAWGDSSSEQRIETLDERRERIFNQRQERQEEGVQIPVDSPKPGLLNFQLRQDTLDEGYFIVQFHSGLSQPAESVSEADEYYILELRGRRWEVRKDLVARIIEPHNASASGVARDVRTERTSSDEFQVRVQLLVGSSEDLLQKEVRSYIAQRLRSIDGISVTAIEPDILLSVVVVNLKTAGGLHSGFAISCAAEYRPLGPSASFGLAQHLLRTGDSSSLEALCASIVALFDSEVVEPAREMWEIRTRR